jgi:Glycosyltransferase family 92
MKKCYAAACVMVKDELDIREWVAYHLAIGIEHLLIYDNESRLPTSVTLAGFIAAGLVTNLTVRGRFKQCTVTYVDALERSRGRSRWIAFLDADEFLLPHVVDDIRVYLSCYERFSAIGINWQIFGDNGHTSRPPGLVIENYTRRGPVDYEENRHVKSIVDANEVLWPCNPHCFHMRNGHGMVDSDGHRIPVHFRFGQAFRCPPAVAQIQLNHYYTRSLEDFRLKQSRGGGAGVRRRADEVFETSHRECNGISDERILRFRAATMEKVDEFSNYSIH